MDHYISWEDFAKVDMRVGTVLEASPLTNARKPAFVLRIDFGDLGILKSSAQITDLYNLSDLLGQQVVAVVNLAPKQVGNVMSECLVLGALRQDGCVAIIQPERPAKTGSKIS